MATIIALALVMATIIFITTDAVRTAMKHKKRVDAIAAQVNATTPQHETSSRRIKMVESSVDGKLRQVASLRSGLKVETKKDDDTPRLNPKISDSQIIKDIGDKSEEMARMVSATQMKKKNG